jgi:hypothetical protein
MGREKEKRAPTEVEIDAAVITGLPWKGFLFTRPAKSD